MISVIVPVYNAEKYLSSCIDSILEQSFKDFEIVLVDDGSTDSSLDICKKYENEHSNIIVVSKQNEGPGLTRQRGIEECGGEYIVFVDADDWVEKTYIEKLFQAISDNDVDMARCNSIIDDKKIVFRMWNPPFCNAVLNKDAIHSIVIPLMIAPEKESNYNQRLGRGCVCTIFKKSIIVDNNISFGKLMGGEDALFSIEYLLHCNNIVFIEDYLYHYIHQNPNSLSQNVSAVNKEERNKKRNNLVRLLSELDSFPIIKERFEQEDRRAVFLDLRMIVLHSNDLSFSKKIKAMRSVLTAKESVDAFKKLKLKSLSFKLRVLYFFIKYRFTTPLYFLIKIRGR